MLVTAAVDELELLEGWSEADPAIRWRFAPALSAQTGTASSAVMVGKLEPGTRGGMHTHTAEEIAFIHTGTAELVIGGERRRVGRGGMALIPARVPHDVYSVGEETLTMVNFFPSAIFLTTFEDEVAPIGVRTLLAGAPQELLAQPPPAATSGATSQRAP
jgi:quercetin dioxygenase-like cupin family protein